MENSYEKHFCGFKNEAECQEEIEEQMLDYEEALEKLI